MIPGPVFSDRKSASELSPSARLLCFLAAGEAVRTRAYKDVAGVWTIGIGHTSGAGEPRPHRGMKITTREAYEILVRDVTNFAAGVADLIEAPVNQHEFDAMVSFAFNVGLRAFRKSSVLRHLNKREYAKVPASLMRYVKVRKNGKLVRSRGLENRRRHEIDVFKRGKYGPCKAGVMNHIEAAMKGSGFVPADTIRHVQRRLKALGYHEVGTIDGIAGSRTAAAIMAFRNDNGMPISPDIDDDLLAALASAPEREIAGPRKKATAKYLRALGSTDIAASDKGVHGGVVVTGLAGVAGAAKTVKEIAPQIESGSSAIRSVLEAAAPVAAFVQENAIVLLAVAGGFIVWQAIRLRRNRIRRHRSGEYLSR